MLGSDGSVACRPRWSVGGALGADLYAAVLVVGARPADASDQRFWARKQVMEVTRA
jgi:hypothetical protein